MRGSLFEKPQNRGDVWILVLTLGMALFGCLMIYSAGSYVGKVQYGSEWYFVNKQLIGVVLGTAAMSAAAFIPYRRLIKLKIPLIIAAFVLLALVFVPGIGVTNYGATRWIGFGSFTLQPSEIAKYAFVLFADANFSSNYKKATTFIGIAPVLIVGTGLCLLIIAEPNMSITMCVGLLMLALVFLSGTNLKTFALMLVPFIVAVPVLIILEPYRLQINSTQKYRFLPFAESDFIMSVMGEELGFVGLAVFFLVCIFLITRGIKIAAGCGDRFGYLLSAGITLVYGIQVMVNALVVSGTIPPTGLPLPLVSSGNTSLIITMTSMGVLYNISTFREHGGAKFHIMK